MSCSLPRTLLSRFLINLREVDSSENTLSETQNSSRFSTLNFRSPAFNELMGNLGQPLELMGDHIEGGEDNNQDGETNLDTAQRDAEDIFESTLADLEAAGMSGNVSISARATLNSHDMYSEEFEPEVRHKNLFDEE